MDYISAWNLQNCRVLTSTTSHISITLYHQCLWSKVNTYLIKNAFSLLGEWYDHPKVSFFFYSPFFSFSVLWCVCNIDNNFTQWAISFYLIGFLVHIQVYVYVIYASFLVRCVFAISKRKGCTFNKSWYGQYLTDTIYSKEICTFTITVSKFIQTFDLTKNKTTYTSISWYSNYYVTTQLNLKLKSFSVNNLFPKFWQMETLVLCW